MDVGTAVALVVVAITAAALLTTRNQRTHRSQTGAGPMVVKDSVPEDLRGGSPTLQERRRRAELLARQRSGGVVGDSASGTGDGVENIDTEFEWRVGTGVSFSDVGGMESVKEELRQDVIVPLNEKREAAEELGVSATNILLHGPPGTGKTFVAKALATELGLPFAELSGSDVQSKWINESSQNVSHLFSEAETVAERCSGAVVFVDELDSVLEHRSRRNAHAEDCKVVNEFLNHLEGTGNDIVFIGASNRFDSLDDAGVRSGRIDKHIHVGLPGVDGRVSILRAQLRDRPHSVSDSVIERAAKECDGCSAADLAAVVDDAARQALLQGRGGIVDENLLTSSRSR